MACNQKSVSLMLSVVFFTSGLFQLAAAQPISQYPKSEKIKGIEWDFSSKRTLAPGSDNWAITWSNDDHQYTTWGDGGGFGGDNQDGRVSLGFARIEGDDDSYAGKNVWGGKDPENNSQFGGKSYGIISIDGTLYMWRAHQDSTGGPSAYGTASVYRSSNHAASWTQTSAVFNVGFFCPTFLQFGKDYSGARDEYVYSYAPEQKRTDDWDVNTPGEIILARVPKSQVGDIGAYEFFAGMDGGNPQWLKDVNGRKPVFEDPENGVMRTSVLYNAPLQRYFLITQQVSRYRDEDFHIGIYDAPEPWGPWTTVLFENAEQSGLISSGYWKTVFFNFSNKWTSADGLSFVLVYTDKDDWATIKGRFIVNDMNRVWPPSGLKILNVSK